MSRLTKKDKNGYEVKGDNPNTSIAMDISNAIQKLGQLEDIEDEIGIDLITFFKVYNSNHVFIKGKDYMWKINRFNKHSISVGVNHKKTLYFKDYGKTWSLDKNELTNE